MSILVSVTEKTNRQGTNNPAVPKLYGIPFISKVLDNGSSATIILDGKRENEERIVSESYAAVNGLIKLGYVSAVLPLTKIDGTLISLNADGIVEAYDNADGKGVVRYRDNEKIEDVIYTVDENIAAILALAPKITTGTESFLIYEATLNQSGTSAPTVIVHQNTLGGTVVWSRNSTGIYIGTLVGAFSDATTLVYFNNSYGTVPNTQSRAYSYLQDEIWVETRNISGSPVDSELYQASLLVKVKI